MRWDPRRGGDGVWRPCPAIVPTDVSEPTAPPQPFPGLPADAVTAAPGVFDFYRSLVAAASDVSRRYRLALWSELALIGLYFAIRTMGTDTTQMTV